MASTIMKGYRVLDLTDKKGMLCGKILAELGMDVIKVEQPGGDPSRMLPPYYHNEEDPEKSLFWFSYNINKRGITLNLESEEGRELFKKLVEKSDFVIESFAPGYMKSLGLGYDDLAKIKPDIIMASITPFGQEGPNANLHAESDLVLQAMSTMLKRTGDPDRAPVKISDVPQSWLHGCMDAAEGIMVANYYRSMTGQGQYVDCSIMESIIGDPVVIGDFNANGVEGKRTGSNFGSSGKKTKMIWHCKDGCVNYMIKGGKAGYANNTGMTKWLREEGMPCELMESIDWNEFNWFAVTQEEIYEMEAAIAPLFLKYTKDELMSMTTERGMLLGKIADPEDLLKDVQLESRDFWTEIDHDELGTLTYPGPFAKFSLTPIEGYVRAPHIGEHNKEVYSELCGLTDAELEKYRSSGIV